MLGTTRFLTDASGGQIEPAVYTAFGELVSGTSGRFGYVGAHGYQSSDEMPYRHVGHRYYDPTTGRFLQRDPIGIDGGLNVFAYVRNAPTRGVDPGGLIDGNGGGDSALYPPEGLKPGPRPKFKPDVPDNPKPPAKPGTFWDSIKGVLYFISGCFDWPSSFSPDTSSPMASALGSDNSVWMTRERRFEGRSQMRSTSPREVDRSLRHVDVANC